jgi:hypothetical protein
MIASGTRSRADTLLRYLWVRRTGSALQFREAVKYCFDDGLKHVAAARRLSALGHVEFDWDGPDLRWRVVRPSFYRVGGNLNLCGLLLKEDATAIEQSGAQFGHFEDAFLAQNTIRRYFIADPDGSVARRLAESPFSFPVAKEAYYDLLQRLAPLQNLLLRYPLQEPPPVALRFNVETRRFDQEIEGPVASDGLLKAPGFGKPQYFLDNRAVDLTTGLWLALRDDPSLIIEHDETSLTVPGFPDLPPLYERALYLSGARRQDLSDGRFQFSPLVPGVAHMIASRLGVKLVKVPRDT